VLPSRCHLPVFAAVLLALAVSAAMPGAARGQQGPETSASEQPAAAAADKPSEKRMPALARFRAVAPDAQQPDAKQLFGSAGIAAPLAPRAIGFYSRGCLAGGEALAVDGPVWQAMRLSRNRNWGHPKLIRLIERLAADGQAQDGWPGLLVGDISQPRGGPMLTGHASHQVGLDADIWLTPMPDRRLSEQEREEIAATSMLGPDGVLADAQKFTQAHARIILRAASYAETDRIFVHPGIKRAMCEMKDLDRTHFRKVQPLWGHHYHFHIRITCPPDDAGCTNQQPRPTDDGCGKEVDQWLALLRRPAPPIDPTKPAPPPRPKPRVTMEQLPPDCRLVLNAGRSEPVVPAAPAAGAGVPAKSSVSGR
jgi:penicillin-insensitive murein endopeptidase